MFLAFKHTTDNGTFWNKLLDKIIALRTNGPAVHAELVFSDGLSFSSSQWDGGVRFKEINYTNDPKWELVPVFITEEDEFAIRRVADQLADLELKYDWKGILGFMLGKQSPGSKNAFFCSEVCVYLLQGAGIFEYLQPEATDPWLLECVARERHLNHINDVISNSVEGD